jgi:hypothetical protein
MKEGHTGAGRSVVNWPIGLTVYDRERAFPGYTLLTPFHSPIVYLLDMNGAVVHIWFVPQTIHAKYTGGGNILVTSLSKSVEAWVFEIWGEDTFKGTWLSEFNWQGDLVWSYRLKKDPTDPHDAKATIGWDSKYKVILAHHDFQRLPNGNTMMLCVAGVTNKDISDHELKDDYFLEVKPDGTPIWIWHADEHFDEFTYSDETRRLMREAPGFHMGLSKGDYQHTNTLEILPANELEKKDSRFRAGNILSCQRNANTIYIVDRQSGKVVWDWGRDHLVGPHHPTMLPNGNILVYDNGGQGGYPRRTRIFTRLVELDPVSGQIVWLYMHDPIHFYHHNFFSFSWGSAQRLPNGNTLSLDANRGRLFEVTKEGEIVWEYVNGFMGKMTLAKTIRLETGVYRVYRIPYDKVPDFSSDFDYNYEGEATILRHPGMA